MAPQACILIVDDDTTVLQLLEDVLSIEYEIKAVSDPFAAWDLLQHEHFDLALVDLGMPRLDGIELVQRIRNQPDIRELPIIALSAFDQLRQRVSDVSVDALVSKPFAITDLENTIARILQKRAVAH